MEGQIMAEIKRHLGDASVVFPTDPLRQTEFTVKLTDAELRSLYWEARKLHMADWIASLLDEYGYPEQNNKTLLEMAERYMDRVESGDRLGELEHDVFEYMMENDYPEIEAEEDDDG
jgi:hypothetical protein